jgi:hypothetical protein
LFPENIPTVEKKLKKSYQPMDWNPFPVDIWFGRYSAKNRGFPLTLLDLDSRPMKKTPSLTVGANCGRITPYLQLTFDKAWQKYNAKAYLHWYEKYNCTQVIEFRKSSHVKIIHFLPHRQCSKKHS